MPVKESNFPDWRRGGRAVCSIVVAVSEITIREAEEFIAAVPWRQVQDVPMTRTPEREAAGWVFTKPDPHQYVIKGWREVDTELFDGFVWLIKREGYKAKYRAPYRPDFVMTNHYLEIDGWCYWFIHPNMLNREQAEHRKHVPIPE